MIQTYVDADYVVDDTDYVVDPVSGQRLKFLASVDSCGARASIVDTSAHVEVMP